MDDKEKYEAALEKAKQVYTTPYTAGWDRMKELIEYIFPELAESEDEKIRAYVILVVKDWWRKIAEVTDDVKWPTEEEMLAYLEKQKEQKSAECVTEEEMKRSMDSVHDFKMFAANLAKTFNITYKRDIDWHNFCAGLLTYLEQNKPAEWGEDELDAIDQAIMSLEERYDPANNSFVNHKLTFHEAALALKSIRSKKTTWRWIPSTAHIDAIKRCLDHLEGDDLKVVQDLYNSIKKCCK